MRTRWILGALASSEVLVFQDDDILLPEAVYEEFESLVLNNPCRIYSLHGRNPDSSNSYNFNDAYGDVEIVLTRAASLHRDLVSTIFEGDLKFFKGRRLVPSEFPGDDIFMSYCVYAKHGLKHLAVHRPHSNLPSPHGISSMPNYRQIRTCIMRQCQEYFRCTQRQTNKPPG